MIFGSNIRLNVLAALFSLVAAVGGAQVSVNAGFYPLNQYNLQYVQVEVRNSYAVPVTYRLRFLSSEAESSLEGDELPPGESRYHHLLFLSNYYGGEALVHETGERFQFHFWQEDPALRVLYLRYPQRNVDVTEATEIYRAFESNPKIGGQFRVGTAYGYGGGYSPPGSTALRSFSRSEEVLIQAHPRQASDRWQPHVVWQQIWIDKEAEDSLAAEQREALYDWVKAGGVLLRLGAATNPTERGLLAGRVIDLPRERDDLAETATRNYVDLPKNLLFYMGIANPYFGSGRYYSPHMRYGHQQTRQVPFHVQPEEGVGSLGALILSTLFAFAVGPLNYWLMRRRGTLRMIFLTVPALAILCCLLIVVYFIVSRGTVRQGAALSITLLDERSGEGVTHTQNMFYSGIFPLSGFRYDDDSLVLPFDADPNHFWELTKGQHLRQGFFRPLVPFHVAAIQPFASREQLVLKREDGQIAAYNGYESDIIGGVAVLDGQPYRLDEIRKGGRTELVPMAISREDIAADFSRFLNFAPLQVSNRPIQSESLTLRLRELASGAFGRVTWSDNIYLIFLEKGLDSVDQGIDWRDLGSLHIVAGAFGEDDLEVLLAEAEESARAAIADPNGGED